MNIKTPREIKASYLRDAVYAANDGIITTFAVVAGAQGAGLAARYVLIFGFASLLADALSMAAGNYLGIKSEKAYNGGQLLSRFTRKIFKNKDKAINHSLITYASFVVAGIFTLIPYMFGSANSFIYSLIILFASMGILGYFRSIFSQYDKHVVIMETMLIGGTAAVIAFVIGVVIDSVIPNSP